MANITLRLSTGMSERLLHGLDLMLDRMEEAVHALFVDQHADFREAAQDARIRRLAAHGCGGQALI